MTALRVVFPLAALMGIGALVRKGGLIDRPSMRKVDVLSFRLFMPTLLFKNIYESDLLHHSGGLGFVYIPVCMLLLFCVAGVYLQRRLCRSSVDPAQLHPLRHRGGRVYVR